MGRVRATERDRTRARARACIIEYIVVVTGMSSVRTRGARISVVLHVEVEGRGSGLGPGPGLSKAKLAPHYKCFTIVSTAEWRLIASHRPVGRPCRAKSRTRCSNPLLERCLWGRRLDIHDISCNDACLAQSWLYLFAS